MIDPGAIEVTVCAKGGRIALSLTNARTDAAARLIAAPANRAKARRLFTMLYGLCPAAHLACFDAAKARALGRAESVRRAADGGFVEAAILLEGVVETLRVLLMEASHLLGRRLEPEDARTLGALRSGVATLAEHMLAMDPFAYESQAEGGALVFNPVRLEAARETARSVEAGARALAEKRLFGMTPAAVLSELSSYEALEAWAARAAEPPAASPAAALLARFLSRSADFGEIESPMLPSRTEKESERFADELLHRMLHEPGFDLAPFWGGSPCLTGAAARMRRHPLAAAMRRRRGLSPSTLLAARILETALGLELARRYCWPEKAGGAELPNYEPMSPLPGSLLWTYSPASGIALALAETGRGLLAHALRLAPDGSIAELKITSPTEWQFAPYGPGQRMLLAISKHVKEPRTPEERQAIEQDIRETLFGLDACVPLELRFGCPTERKASAQNAFAGAA